MRESEKKVQLAPNQPMYKVLKAAVKAIKSSDFTLARQFLRQAAVIDMENPEIYNLLGISYEQEGDYLKASRFYRVAYYLDQTFKAPSENLERVCSFYRNKLSSINWGLERIGGKFA